MSSKSSGDSFATNRVYSLPRLWPLRILHVSDLHCGRRETPETLAALRELAARIDPELVLATGDLSHRGRREQLESAQRSCAASACPSSRCQGTTTSRTRSRRASRARTRSGSDVFGTTEPAYSSERLHVVGACSVRPWRQQSGALPTERLARLAAALGDAPAGALRVVALHHHLAAPPWRAPRKRPLKARDRVLEALAAAGAELVVGGHVHQAGIAERREFEALEDEVAARSCSPRPPASAGPGRAAAGEARGVNVYEADAASLTVTTIAWDGAAFAETGRRTFPRG